MSYINRKHIRLRDFDYSKEYGYFITICTKNREDFFWNSKENIKQCRGLSVRDPSYEAYLNKYGIIVSQCWNNIAHVYNNITLDEFVVMPNHIHGIIIIEKKKIPDTIGYVVSQFKSAVTKKIRKISANKDLEIWQRNYYEHVIREKEIDRIRWYIINNPININTDKYN